MLCLLCPFALAESTGLPIETRLDSAAESALNVAAVESTLTVDTPDNTYVQAEDGQLLWPMMPNETLAQLAKTFYPDSPILEQRFMQKAIRLTKALGVTLLPDSPFKRVQVIAIPDEKEVRAVTHRIKRLEEITHAQNQLQLSYQLKLSDQLKKIIPPPPKPSQATSPHSPNPATSAKPKTALPNAQVPAATPWTHIWQQAQSTGASWLATTKAYWLTVSAGALPSLPLPAAIHARLSHPQWRNGLYLALLVCTGLGLWCLQKRYMRRQVALLNTITTTLENTSSDATETHETMPANVADLVPYQAQEQDRTAVA